MKLAESDNRRSIHYSPASGSPPFYSSVFTFISAACGSGLDHVVMRNNAFDLDGNKGVEGRNKTIGGTL